MLCARRKGFAVKDLVPPSTHYPPVWTPHPVFETPPSRISGIRCRGPALSPALAFTSFLFASTSLLPSPRHLIHSNHHFRLWNGFFGGLAGFKLRQTHTSPPLQATNGGLNVSIAGKGVSGRQSSHLMHDFDCFCVIDGRAWPPVTRFGALFCSGWLSWGM